MKKVLIVEDNKASANVLCKILKEMQQDLAVYAVNNAASAYQKAMELNIDLFIVDIVLDTNVPGDVSGMVFADRIRTIKRYEFKPLIFITSLEDSKLHAYSKLHCYDYIEKPFDLNRAKKTIENALKFPTVVEEKEYIYFRKDGILYSRKLDEIVYIVSSQRKVMIYSVDDELSIPYKTCNDLLTELDSELFLQCSRSTIVNRKFIDYVDPANRMVKMQGVDKELELGIVMKKKFLKALENES